MKIIVKFFTPNKKDKGFEPETFTYTGNYAIEQMIIKTTEKYFGVGLSKKIESLLKGCE